MAEKTYHIAPYLGLFNASVTHIWFKRCFHIQKDRWNVAVNSRYLQSGQKTISFGQKQRPKKKIQNPPQNYHIFLYFF